MRLRGRDSRCLCGPVEGFGAQMPPILFSIQCFGAFSRFMCFFMVEECAGGHEPEAGASRVAEDTCAAGRVGGGGRGAT